VWDDDSLVRRDGGRARKSQPRHNGPKRHPQAKNDTAANALDVGHVQSMGAQLGWVNRSRPDAGSGAFMSEMSTGILLQIIRICKKKLEASGKVLYLE
jgi:hypothetical protein